MAVDVAQIGNFHDELVTLCDAAIQSVRSTTPWTRRITLDAIGRTGYACLSHRRIEVLSGPRTWISLRVYAALDFSLDALGRLVYYGCHG